MMIVIHNLLLLPLVMFVWCLQALLMLLGLHLLLRSIEEKRGRRIEVRLASLIDPVEERVRQWIMRCFGRRLPSWLFYSALFVIGLCFQQMLVGCIVGRP